MNSVSRPVTVQIQNDSLSDPVSAFRLALDLFGAADLTEFLPPRDSARYLETLSELVRAELIQSWNRGQPIFLEAFQERYPELFENPVLVYPIALEEFNLKHQAGEGPNKAEYCQKFDLECDDWPTLKSEEPNDGGGGPPKRDPMTDPSRTRPGQSVAKREGGPIPSDPEIVWKLNQKMTQMPKVGDEFLGFSLLAELGKGAFGKVFLAQQGELAGRFVALKVAAGLFSESQTLAQLQHTHIVPIYSYHHSPLFQAVCMPFLGSTTLAHILADIRAHDSMPSSGKELLSTLNFRRRSTRRFEDSSKDSVNNSAPSMVNADEPTPSAKPEPPTKPATTLELEGMSYVDSILWLAVRLADGLAHAHERGILHRDLKPANILLTDEGLPMLLDFNLAQDTKQVDSAAAASIGGTLPYMAPEHLEAFRGNAATVDARSDLYSLGVILFELLTAAAPFPSYRKLPTREVVNRMILDRGGELPSLRGLNPSIPPAVEAVVMKCLQADPKNRYATARQMQEDLQRQLEDKPLKHAPNPSWRERSQKFRRRHPRLTSTSVVAGVALALITGLGSLVAVREEQNAKLEARQTLARFQDDAETTRFLLNARTARNQLDEGRQACRSALGHFQVLENAAWRDGPAARRLPADDKQRLQEEVGQLLVILAHTQQLAGERENDPTRRQEILNEGLHFCSLATTCFPQEQTPLALWKQKGELQRRLGDADLARKSFDKAQKADPKTLQDRYLTARLLAEEGKFRAALAIIKDAIAQSPQDYNLNFLQGICHDYLAQHNDAIACYRTCIALRPRFHGAYYNRGLTYLRQNNYVSAMADFDRVVSLRADFVDVYVPRATALQGLGKPAEAIADLTTALDLGVDETRVFFLRADLREKTGDKEAARRDFAEGMRRVPTDERSWIARGLAQLPGDPKKALHDFDQALALNPRSLAGLQNKAHVLGKYFKQLGEAVKALDKAVDLFPDDCRPRAGRGVYLGRLGKRDAAIKDAEQALLIDTSPPNLYQVAGIYALTSKEHPDDQREAMKLLTAALKKGFGYEYLDIDRDLDPIRTSPVFRRVIDASRVFQGATKANRSAK